ncbi:MAG: TIM-barrel domain-containing protein [Candidatus Sericytochromatia bacterium]|nr:TIM-barrel domain-containing protein [Candidatus Sericytochromatia bacterium]
MNIAIPAPPAATVSVEGRVLRVRGGEGSTRFMVDLDRVRATWDPVAATQLLGIFAFRGGDRDWKDLPLSPLPWTEPGMAPLAWWPVPGAPWRGLALEVASRPDGGLDLKYRWVGGGDAPTRLALSWSLGAEEGLYGLGSRTNALDQHGRILPCWVEEGGNGKSERPLPGVGNVPWSSHAPVPFLLSSAGYGLLAGTTARTVWDLGATDPARLRLTLDDPSPTLSVWTGAAPDEVLARATAAMGRPRVPPAWVMAPAEWGKGGQEAVLARARRLREARVPFSALWYEDWVGLQHGPLPGLTHMPWGRWQADPASYPDVRGLNRSLNAMGLKALGYFNPFVPGDHPQRAVLEGLGGVVRDAAGHPMDWPGPFGLLSMLDLWSEGLRPWVEERLQAFAEDGFSGGMVDFGEWLPHGAVLSGGRNGATAHNAYPVAWADLHRRFWERARPDGDWLTYVRAGYTGTPASCTYMWAADQDTDWGEADGFPSALTAILTAGLSGIPFMTHDVGGFATLGGPPRTPELLARWLAFGAFSSVMRTHSGQKPALNAQTDGSPQMLELTRKWAGWSMATLPYRHALVAEAARTGLPVMRPLWLSWPADPLCRDMHDTYTLGPDLLVAPVFRPGATKRRLYLPRGTWYDFWDGSVRKGGRWHEVEAPLDHLPVMVREGAILPLLPEGIDTVLEAEDPVLRDGSAAAASLRIWTWPGRPDMQRTLTLADGTTLAHRWEPFPQDTTGRAAQVCDIPWDGRSVLERVETDASGRWSLRVTPPPGGSPPRVLSWWRRGLSRLTVAARP